MISFGEMLFQAHRDCADKPARVLDATLTERVRAWVDREVDDLSEVTIEAVGPWEIER